MHRLLYMLNKTSHPQWWCQHHRIPHANHQQALNPVITMYIKVVLGIVFILTIV